MRQEFMERRIQEANRRWATVEFLEHADEVFALIRKDLRKSLLTVLLRVGKNHLAHRVDTVAFKEHVLGAAESDTAGPESDGVCRLFGRVGICTNAHAGGFGAPIHEFLKLLISLAFRGLERLFDEHLNDFGRGSRDLASVNF